MARLMDEDSALVRRAFRIGSVRSAQLIQPRDNAVARIAILVLLALLLALNAGCGGEIRRGGERGFQLPPGVSTNHGGA
jgi:hypothetical protein